MSSSDVVGAGVVDAERVMDRVAAGVFGPQEGPQPGLVARVLAALRGEAAGAGGGAAAVPGGARIVTDREDGGPVMPGVLDVVDGIAQAVADAVAALPAGEDVPEGWMMDAQGRLVRIGQVRECDRLMDAVTRPIVVEGLILHHLLGRYKERSLGALDEVARVAAAEYRVKIGGAKGNMQMTTYDGAYQVQRQQRDVVSFGPAIQAAKELIDACLVRWSEGARPEMAALVDRAFRASRAGDLRMGPVLELLRLEIEDPQWREAMRALSESIRVSGSATYVRIARRDGEGRYVPVPIDLAAV